MSILFLLYCCSRHHTSTITVRASSHTTAVVPSRIRLKLSIVCYYLHVRWYIKEKKNPCCHSCRDDRSLPKAPSSVLHLPATESCWWGWESNPWPSAYQANVSPTTPRVPLVITFGTYIFHALYSFERRTFLPYRQIKHTFSKNHVILRFLDAHKRSDPNDVNLNCIINTLVSDTGNVDHSAIVFVSFIM